MRKNSIMKEISLLEQEISVLEAKRSRSQAVILEALITKTNPDETDVQFFRTFSAEIEVKREHLQDLYKQLQA